jgi:hypothetical protein
MFGAMDFDEIDDGWRHCDRCGDGFTIWYERVFDDRNENNGFVNDELLCEKCYAEATRK